MQRISTNILLVIVIVLTVTHACEHLTAQALTPVWERQARLPARPRIDFTENGRPSSSPTDAAGTSANQQASAIQPSTATSSFQGLTPVFDQEASLYGNPLPQDTNNFVVEEFSVPFDTPSHHNPNGRLPPNVKIDDWFQDEATTQFNFSSVFDYPTSRYTIYRVGETQFSFLSRGQGELGMTSLEWTPYLSRERNAGFTFGMGHHFLSGPQAIDLNPRLHEFSIGYQIRETIAQMLSVDFGVNVGVFSDFKGSAQEGVRYPSHAVGMLHFGQALDIVFGVDYLDRDDYKLLPVVGVSWHPPNWSRLRFDLVFPRPRIDVLLNENNRLFFAGVLGGGTWDVEFPDSSEDVITYSDFRLVVGIEKATSMGHRKTIEFGYVFDRQLDLRGVPGTLEFADAFMLRLISSH
ncbi:MAG TPA: hypothetical protein PKD64_18515 [Pirellulaceae bacterium]|nr:hypothetical protein [Pirellulaceae bacterium]HMO94184.1 hypothetical protein [Pirellulaceae bacterium]HMP71195.1 hypothetical protein [Pirellulaceae bacterium]